MRQNIFTGETPVMGVISLGGILSECGGSKFHHLLWASEDLGMSAFFLEEGGVLGKPLILNNPCQIAGNL